MTFKNSIVLFDTIYVFGCVLHFSSLKILREHLFLLILFDCNTNFMPLIIMCLKSK